MAKYKTSKASATAAIDWHNLKASGQILENASGHVVLRLSGPASRVAVGIADPGVSTTAGIAVDNATVEVILGAEAAEQTIWVQTPASQERVYVEADGVAASRVIAAFS
jgi:hypothetical protein